MRQQWEIAWRAAREVEQAEHSYECDLDMLTGCLCECGIGEQWRQSKMLPLFDDAYTALWIRNEPAPLTARERLEDARSRERLEDARSGIGLPF
jgi:hypothetical protein